MIREEEGEKDSNNKQQQQCLRNLWSKSKSSVYMALEFQKERGEWVEKLFEDTMCEKYLKFGERYTFKIKVN